MNSNSPKKFSLSPEKRRLTGAEKNQYEHDGYLKNLPVFSDKGVSELQSLFEELASRLPDNIDINQVNMWHKASIKFNELCRNSTILDYVEDLLGPNFYQWGGQFFTKYPNDGSVVPWHQDAQYWPLSPQRTVTVWLAVFDSDAGNGAMQIVKGSHKKSIVSHHTNNAPHLALTQEADADTIDHDEIVTINLKAGEISLHDDGTLHGSGANISDRIRSGITMRFCPTNTKCDLDVWPTFEAYLARGIDTYNLNPTGPRPTSEMFPVRKFQHSSDFL